MVALVTITIIVFLILFFLVIPLRLQFSYQDQPSVLLKYSFLKFTLYPTQGKINDRTHKNKRNTQNREEGKSNLNFSSLRKEYGFLGAINYLTELLKPLIQKPFTLCRKIKITNLSVNIVIADSDAAQAAIEYGAVAAVIYPFLGWTSALIQFDNPSVNLGIDYAKEKSSVSVCGCVSILPLHIITTAISIFFAYIASGVNIPQFLFKKAK